MAEVRMPKMGDSMEEGTILRWMKKEGDMVAVDEPIAEVETDKANVEIPAEEGGTISKIVVQEGQTVAVGAIIAVIGDAGAASTNGASSAASPSQPVSLKEESPPASSTSVPRQEYHKGGGPTSHSETPPIERLKASPVARKIAEKLGLDLAIIRGTGPGGRIVERDVRAFSERSGGAVPSLPSLPSQPTTPAPRPSEAPAPTAGREIEISKMRKAIAKRTTLSKQTIPHFYLTMPIEMEKCMDLLDQLNASTPESKITINDLIVKACAVALVRMPEVNVSYTGEERIKYHELVNVGIAVGTDAGLTIPVIKDCGVKTLRQISVDARALIERARNNQLVPQDMSGGTFSVSNLGMFGIEEFAAIINPPESALLAVGAVLPEAVPGPDDGFEVRRRMRVTLSCDHRTVDGLLGAKFLREVRRLLENPFELLA
jgi:pyruvate dehydrogenase E2 component (dihydrolipoamide acetyltransferase)